MAFLTELRTKTHPFFTTATNLLFPPRCTACGVDVEAAHSVCPDCFAALSMIAAPLCVSCGEPFAYDMGEGAICAHCLDNPPPFKAARAALRYDDASRSLVTKLKYADQQQLVPMLAQQMWRAGAALCDGADWLVPVPLHPKRLRSRMFNQSALLAHALSDLSGVPVMADGLLRVVDTPPQASLPREERLKNVRRAFRANHARAVLLHKATVVLIDDVVTTGATARACSKALLAAGAKEVRVITAAKTVRDDG